MNLWFSKNQKYYFAASSHMLLKASLIYKYYHDQKGFRYLSTECLGRFCSTLLGTIFKAYYYDMYLW